MAKREFIDKHEMKIKGYQHLSGYVVTDTVIDSVVDEVPTFTEQDIVKPYLDKLKDEIQEKSFDRFTYLEIMNMIDSLLSEQGDTE